MLFSLTLVSYSVARSIHIETIRTANGGTSDTVDGTLVHCCITGASRAGRGKLLDRWRWWVTHVSCCINFVFLEREDIGRCKK